MNAFDSLNDGEKRDDWCDVVVEPGVDEGQYLVYEWTVRDTRGRLVARYIGKAANSKRPRQAYRRNVKSLLLGKGWHGSASAFRQIHYCLADAQVKRRAIRLTLVENAADDTAVRALERRYQAERPQIDACGPHDDLRALLNTYPSITRRELAL